MRKTIAPQEMKRVEMEVMARTSITGEQLMQRAAAHVADAVEAFIRNGCVVCLCGTGNNGGDGMAAMRILAGRHADFTGECWIMPGKLSTDAERELARLKQTAVRVRMLENDLPEVQEIGCIIDALFGTGLCRPVEGMARACCEWIHRQDAPVVAVDIPSGLRGLTGDVLGCAVQADITVTFHRPKTGLYLKNGPDHAGKIVVGDIGIPASFDDADGLALLEKSDLTSFLPKRSRVSHKGDYGRVLLFAGSRGMAGAAAIAAMAALRTGAGLVTVACPDGIVDIVQILCPCATCLPLPEAAKEAWPILETAVQRCDAIGAGCGLGQSQWALELIKRLVTIPKPLALDADALNLMAREGLEAPGAFLTPHPAEAARLLHCDIAEVLADMPSAARKLADQNCVILKGACSVLDDGLSQAINPYGTPGMAKGGSGDALTGILTALLAARGDRTNLELMQTACALHGLAGEMAAEKYGERGMLATDLCACLGLVECKNPNIPNEKGKECSRSLGRQVMVVVEHKMGSRDERERSRVYPVNVGYVQDVLDEENRWQDACVVADEPLEWVEGAVGAIVHIQGRETWVVAPENMRLQEAQVRQITAFLGDAEHVELL